MTLVTSLTLRPCREPEKNNNKERKEKKEKRTHNPTDLLFSLRRDVSVAGVCKYTITMV